MIHKIFSNLDTFKEIEFHDGFNIVLADKTSKATNQQTRNRAGKTSLVLTVDFLLGAECRKESIFKNSKLVNWYFGMEFDLDGEKVKIKRSGKTPSELEVLNGETDNWPITTHIDKTNGQSIISNNDWKTNLGKLIFKLPAKKKIAKYNPSFRALASYFLRRENSGAFETHSKNAGLQQMYDSQISLSYLLGLDWSIPRKMQLVRDKEKVVQKIKKGMSEEILGELIGSTSQIRTELAISEKKTNQLKGNLATFKVIPEYHELEKEASQLTTEIGNLSNENLLDYELIEHLNKSIKDETPPSYQDVKRLYEEAGVILSEHICKHFDELVEFHETIIKNRQFYLLSELENANRRVENRNLKKDSLSGRVSQIIQILDSHGALDQYSKLNSELVRLEAETEALKNKLNAAEQLENTKVELELERTNLLIQLQRNYHEQGEFIRHIIATFEEISNMLYDEAGSLEIIPTKNGPEFEIKIQGKKSKGIKNMQIFCFDLMLMQLLCEKEMSPGFLIHDSHLFDPVDERQVATALEIAAKKATEHGFQYIVTMNSDKLPTSFSEDFNVEDYIVSTRLTDATEDGGLFGIRFN